MEYLIVINGNAGSYAPPFEARINEACKGPDLKISKTADTALYQEPIYYLVAEGDFSRATHIIR